MTTPTLSTFWRDCDRVLRGAALPQPDAPASATPTINDAPAFRRLLTIIVGCGLLYGAVMGAYALRDQSSLSAALERVPQVLYSALKVPLLFGVTASLGMPSFWLFNLLMGLGEDWGRVLRGLILTQTTLALVLVSLAPLTLLCYFSTNDYYEAVGFNALMFALAAFCAQQRLRTHYVPLIAHDERHRLLLRAWLLIYAFVGIQMGWVLRPFIGDPTKPAQFFRDRAWSNAYEFVARLAWHLVSGHNTY